MARSLAIAVGAAASAAAVPYNFIAFGDFGTGSSLQRENAAGINAFCAADASRCSTVLDLGDSFYNGPLNTSDSRWKTEFMDMYTVALPPGGWKACLGNHDYSGSVQAEFDFDADPRWSLPASNYSFVIPEADLTVVVVDTPRSAPSYMAAPYGDCNERCATQLAEVGCTTATAGACFASHVAWVNETLAGVTTKWRFVMGHHPIGGSDGVHMPLLAPVLAAHGVQAYLAGHVHNLQHAQGADGVNYFISGAGAFVSPTGAETAAVKLPGARAQAQGSAPHDLPLSEMIKPGHPAHPLRAAWVSEGPGFLALSLDNDATPPTATATFYLWNGTQVLTTTFTA